MTDFRSKLKALRDAEVAERVPLTDDELGLNDGTEQFLKARDDVARQIEQLMRDFIAESPQFTISHGFFEGKYSISLSCDELCKDHRGEVDKCFSRLNFLLSPCSTDWTFEITSKLTVLNRDLPKSSAHGNLADTTDIQSFRQFVETETLRFAREYFALRQPGTRERLPAPIN